MAAQCILNAQDCSLGLQLLQLPEGGETATPPAQGACGFAWHGARGTIGTYGGRHRFSVRLLQVGLNLGSSDEKRLIDYTIAMPFRVSLEEG